MILPGDSVLVRGDTLLSKAIITVGKSYWSHCAMGSHVEGLIFEANLLMCLTDESVTRLNYPYRIYRFKSPEHRTIATCAAKQMFDKYNGDLYAALQLVWYLWRWTVEFLHLPKRFAIYNFLAWIPKLNVCVQVEYRWYEAMDIPEVNQALNDLGRKANSVEPRDIEWICERLVQSGVMVIADEKY